MPIGNDGYFRKNTLRILADTGDYIRYKGEANRLLDAVKRYRDLSNVGQFGLTRVLEDGTVINANSRLNYDTISIISGEPSRKAIEILEGEFKHAVVRVVVDTQAYGILFEIYTPPDSKPVKYNTIFLQVPWDDYSPPKPPGWFKTVRIKDLWTLEYCPLIGGILMCVFYSDQYGTPREQRAYIILFDARDITFTNEYTYYPRRPIFSGLKTKIIEVSMADSVFPDPSMDAPDQLDLLFYEDTTFQSEPSPPTKYGGPSNFSPSVYYVSLYVWFDNPMAYNSLTLDDLEWSVLGGGYVFYYVSHGLTFPEHLPCVTQLKSSDSLWKIPPSYDLRRLFGVIFMAGESTAWHYIRYTYKDYWEVSYHAGLEENYITKRSWSTNPFLSGAPSLEVGFPVTDDNGKFVRWAFPHAKHYYRRNINTNPWIVEYDTLLVFQFSKEGPPDVIDGVYNMDFDTWYLEKYAGGFDSFKSGHIGGGTDGRFSCRIMPYFFRYDREHPLMEKNRILYYIDGELKMTPEEIDQYKTEFGPAAFELRLAPKVINGVKLSVMDSGNMIWEGLSGGSGRALNYNGSITYKDKRLDLGDYMGMVHIGSYLRDRVVKFGWLHKKLVKRVFKEG